MDEALLAAAKAGHLVLTVNDRLSRNLNEDFDDWQQQQGATAWLRPDILSFSAWMSRCQALLPGLPIFLNKVQSLYVWEAIIAADVEKTGNYLLQIPQTAVRAVQAHQQLLSYDADFSHEHAAEDHRAFLRWRKAWQRLAAAKEWHDVAETPWLLAEAFIAGAIVIPQHVILAGFDELTPDLKHLCSIMQEQGSQVESWFPQPSPKLSHLTVAAVDAEDEVRQCARWIRRLLTADSSVKVGVVAAQMQDYRSRVEEIFTAELDPESLITGDDQQQIFNLSMGQGLDREGVIHAALRLLRLGLRPTLEDLSWLLLTPYVANGFSENTGRALLDRDLRRLRHAEWVWPNLIRTVRSFPDKYANSRKSFLQQCEVIFAELRRRSKRLPGAWAESFAAFLQKVGWPGERGLSSREYQAVQHFNEALGSLASLDGVALPIDRSEAVRVLCRLVANLDFQAEGAKGAVQVLGELEASGLSFDHLWIFGLHDTALPRAPAPNPFIPLSVQRRHRMKRADSEREHEFAVQIVARLFCAAPEIVFSWPAQDKGVILRPSPFLACIPAGQPVLAESASPTTALWLTRPELQFTLDSQGPPISSRKPFSGGTGIIKDQALCPFRAFAHHRLRAERMEVPEPGIDNLARGTLAHTVLELFWAAVVDQKTLLALDYSTLEGHLAEAVDGALRRLEKELRCDLPPRQKQIERQRLTVLARQWFEVEHRREPFRVTAAEKNHQIKVGRLLIRTRIDRIDELADGTCAIIDYKTGMPDPLQWLDERVTEPQLPAYCLGVPHHKIGAVMFAVVRSVRKECSFRGLARPGQSWPVSSSRALETRLAEKGWSSFDQVLAHWQNILPSAGDAFAAGDARVDPVDTELACRYCDLTGLCRILERPLVLGGDGDD